MIFDHLLTASFFIKHFFIIDKLVDCMYNVFVSSMGI